MTKEEKIKEVYGGLEYIDENGWTTYVIDEAFEYGIEPFGDYETRNHIDGAFEWRPKSPQGVEDNNGWIKIESYDDLPKGVNVMYRIGMFLNDGRFHQDKNLCNHKTALEALSWNYTHYQAITESYPPIY